MDEDAAVPNVADVAAPSIDEDAVVPNIDEDVAQNIQDVPLKSSTMTPAWPRL